MLLTDTYIPDILIKIRSLDKALIVFEIDTKSYFWCFYSVIYVFQATYE